MVQPFLQNLVDNKFSLVPFIIKIFFFLLLHKIEGKKERCVLTAFKIFMLRGKDKSTQIKTSKWP